MMSAPLTQLEEDRSQYQEQLDLVLGSLRDDPDNAELHVLKEELQAALQMIVDSMAEMQPEKKSKNKNNTASPSSPGASDSLAPPAAASSSSSTPVFRVNDTVLARWVTGDKSYYVARIMSVTGSAAAPMYTVRFKSYDTMETLRARDIRPMNSNNNSSSNTSSAPTHAKRRFDSTELPAAPSAPIPPSAAAAPPPPPPPPPPSASDPSAPSFPAAPSSATVPPPPPPARPMDRYNSGLISSAAAQLYPQAEVAASGGAAAAAAAAGGEGPAPKKFKKIKATKQLEAGKNKWQDFSKSKFGKTTGKKDSMFRTPEGIHGRVGFTGSGQTMRKDVTRSRHIYQTNEELD